MLLAVTLALLVDTVDRAARRAQVHELRNRLGVNPEKTGGDTASRLDAIARRWPAWETRYAIAQIAGEAFEASPPRRLASDAGGFSWTRAEALAWRPPQGAKSRADAIFPWIAREIERARRMQERLRDDGGLPAWDDLARYDDYTGPRVYDIVRRLLDEDGLTRILDWRNATHVDVGTKSFEEVVAEAEAWHIALRGRGFEQPVTGGIVLWRDEDGRTLVRLVTKEDLAAEGTSMGHCVGGPLDEEGVAEGGGTYWREVRESRMAIFSVRDAAGVPRATIEVALEDGGVNQVQGPEDGLVPPDQVDAVLALLVELPQASASLMRSARKLQTPAVVTVVRQDRSHVNSMSGVGGDTPYESWKRLSRLLNGACSRRIWGATLSVDEPGSLDAFPLVAPFGVHRDRNEDGDLVDTVVRGEGIVGATDGPILWRVWRMDDPRMPFEGEDLGEVLLRTGLFLTPPELLTWARSRTARGAFVLPPSMWLVHREEFMAFHLALSRMLAGHERG